MNKKIQLLSSRALLLALALSALWAAPSRAVGTPQDSTADVVWGQGGDFTTNAMNKGGISADSLRIPSTVAVDSSGNVYVADTLNCRVLYYPKGSTTATRVYGQGGSFTTTNCRGAVSANSLAYPKGVALDSGDNLYVSDNGDSRVLYYPAGSTTATRVYGQGGDFTTATVNKGGISANSLYYPEIIALDGSDNLYVADLSNHRVLYYPAGSTTATAVYGQGGDFTTKDQNKGGISANSLNGPFGVALDSTGNLYVADHNNNRVLYYPAGSTTATRVYGQGGDFTTVTANKGGLSAQSLYNPDGVAVDNSGSLFVADATNNRVLYYPAGSTTATAVYGQGGDFTTNDANKGGVSADSLSAPNGVAVDSDDNLYVTDKNNNRALEYQSGGSVPAPGDFGKKNPANGGSPAPSSVTLMWGASSDADGYEYCIDTSNDSACTGDNWVSTGTDTQQLLSGLSGSTTYYWQARASNATDTTYADGGTWWSFTTRFPPAAFGKINPVNAATKVSTSPRLSWGASDSGQYAYCIDTSNDDACSTGWVSTGVKTLANLSGLSAGTTYYWQVRAANWAGTTYADAGTWWSFTTLNPPTAFGKTKPANGAIRQPLSLTLYWGKSTSTVASAVPSDAPTYEYCIDTSNNNTCDGSWISTGRQTFVSISGLTANTIYYWQVRATNASGTVYANGGTWWGFKTKP